MKVFCRECARIDANESGRIKFAFIRVNSRPRSLAMIGIPRLRSGLRRSRPSLIRSVANIFQSALSAPRTASDAHRTSVMNDLMSEIDPLILRDDFHQVLFDALRVIVLGQFQAP